MARIFLSHSSVDEREAVALNKWLTDNGWDDVFLDIDPQRGLVAGERWQEALRQAADRCEAVIFIVSPAWANSKWCLAEFLLAKSLHKQIFGVVLKDVPIEELPTEMTSEWQLCRLIGTGPTEIIQFRYRDTDDSIAFMTEGLGRLKTGLKKAGLSADFFPWPPNDEPHRSPFRGLEPLDFEDAAVFFGRDLEILRGLDALRGLRDNPATRLFVILAASGTGKSSFLRAGLLPRLARDDRHFLPLRVVRPETAPISCDRGLAEALAHSMEHVGVSGSNPGDLKARLTAGAGEFASILSSIQEAARVRFVSSDEESRSPAPTLVLPVDQAEELFNADAGPEARKFLSLISEILRDGLSPAGASSPAVSLIVAFTIRSDRYEPLQTAPELAGLQTTVFDDLKPMSATRFREVITGPVQRASTAAERLEIKPDLVDRLVEDCATGADTLPLLSLTLERLYHDFGSDGDLRLDEYIALGGMGNIIKDKIEKVLDPDSEKRRQQLTLLRTAFIPWLVTINPQNDEPMRRLARRSDLPEESLPLVDALAENRLLMRDQRHGETVIEVAHETLLRQWDVLAGWLRDERAALKEADALERQSREWKESKSDESWLWGGQRLQDALALAGRAGFRDRLAGCSEFLERSRNQQEERDAEKLRIQTEKLKAAEDLAAAQSKLAHEQVTAREQAEKAATRAKRQFKFAAVLGVIALALAATALLSSLRARTASLRAEAAEQETAAKNSALNRALVQANEATAAAQEALTRSFVRTIGASDDEAPTPDERAALWELAELDPTNEPVREQVIDHWFRTAESLGRALKHQAQGLHAAVGLNLAVRNHSASKATELADALVKAVENPQETDSSNLSSLGDALAALAARMEPKDAANVAARGAQVLVKAVENPQETDSSNLSSLGDALAALAARMEAKDAARVADRLAKALESAKETDFYRLYSFNNALAALAARIESNDAARIADRLAKALENLQGTDAVRLSSLGHALAALAARMEPKYAAGVAAGGAQVLAKALPQATDGYRLSSLGRTLAALAARMEPKYAAGVAAGGAQVLTKALENPSKTNYDYLSILGSALAALAARMEPKDAARVADRLATAVEKNPHETDYDRLSSLGDALAALAARMEPKDAAHVADRLAKALESPQETDSSDWSSLGEALAALAARMEPKDAAHVADRLAKALESPQETDSSNLSSLGEALAALAARMEPNDAARVADRLANALENPQVTDADRLANALKNPQVTDADRLSSLGHALAALAARMEPKVAARVADRVADRLAKALENPHETDADRLSSLGDTLAALAARMEPKVAARVADRLAKALANLQGTDSSHLSSLGWALGGLSRRIPQVRQTQLVALSNMLLKEVLGAPKLGEEESEKRNQLAELYALLGAQDLAEVLKWPLCVGEAEKIALAELEKKTGREFGGDLWKFAEQAPSVRIKNLNAPPKRPKVEDALKELKSVATGMKFPDP